MCSSIPNRMSIEFPPILYHGTSIINKKYSFWTRSSSCRMEILYYNAHCKDSIRHGKNFHCKNSYSWCSSTLRTLLVEWAEEWQIKKYEIFRVVEEQKKKRNEYNLA